MAAVIIGLMGFSIISVSSIFLYFTFKHWAKEKELTKNKAN